MNDDLSFKGGIQGDM